MKALKELKKNKVKKGPKEMKKPTKWPVGKMRKAKTITELYTLWADKNGMVWWNCPDGYRYGLMPRDGAMTFDIKGKPVMYYNKGVLEVSLDGAISYSATLLHLDDDIPRKLYYATDGGNFTKLKRLAFILRAQGIKGCPVQKNAQYQVMVVAKKSFIPIDFTDN